MNSIQKMKKQKKKFILFGRHIDKIFASEVNERRSRRSKDTSKSNVVLRQYVAYFKQDLKKDHKITSLKVEQVNIEGAAYLKKKSIRGSD